MYREHLRVHSLKELVLYPISPLDINVMVKSEQSKIIKVLHRDNVALYSLIFSIIPTSSIIYYQLSNSISLLLISP